MLTLEKFMSENDLSKIEFPDDIEAAIQTVMLDTGLSKEEIVLQLMSYFFELVEDTGNENVPPLVKKVRAARRQNPLSGQGGR